MFSVGASAPNVFVGQPACTASAAPGGYRVYSSAGELPITSFQAAPLTDGRTFGRLVERDHALAPGFRARFRLFDTQLNALCIFGTAADGQVRCLPLVEPAYREGYFSDAACTQPLATTYVASCTPAYAFQTEPTCQAPAHIFPVTGRYNGTVYDHFGANCVVTFNVPPAMWTIGAELPPTGFVQATAQLE